MTVDGEPDRSERAGRGVGEFLRRVAFAGWRPAGRLRLVFLGLGALCVFVALIGVAGHFVAPRQPWMVVGSAFAPYLMVGAPAAVVLAAAGRQWVVLAPGVLTLAVCVTLEAPLYVASTGPSDGLPITVMTSNLLLGRANPAAVVSAVRRDQVAILMTEELTPQEAAALDRGGLTDLLPYSAIEPRSGGRGVGIWSRYPLSDVEHPAGFLFAFVTARVSIPGVSAAPLLVNTHMPAPWPAPTRPWEDDMARLATLLPQWAGADDTILVGGDFNATPDVAQFRHLLTDGYQDAAEQAGAGYTRTYPANRSFPPLIAIDHVLTHDARATSARTVEISGSDHRALVVRVTVPDQVSRGAQGR